MGPLRTHVLEKVHVWGNPPARVTLHNADTLRTFSDRALTPRATMCCSDPGLPVREPNQNEIASRGGNCTTPPSTPSGLGCPLGHDFTHRLVRCLPVGRTFHCRILRLHSCHPSLLYFHAPCRERVHRAPPPQSRKLDSKNLSAATAESPAHRPSGSGAATATAPYSGTVCTAAQCRRCAWH